MGVEYSLVDADRREFFDLGKGVWWVLDLTAPFGPQVREALEHARVDEAYLTELIGKLETFRKGRTLTLVADAWSDELRGCTEVGSRYQPVPQEPDDGS